MGKEKYLYGAAIQGIQNFIFQTNELADIVGASALVEMACTEAFKEFAPSGANIIGAAGNIKHLFENKEDCEKTVLNFPRKIMEMAPGITISQAVVEMNDDFDLCVEELEKKLRVQRNKPMPSVLQGLIGLKRAPKTGMAAVCSFNGELVDAATLAKKKAVDLDVLCNKAFGPDVVQKKAFPMDVSRMTSHNDWIAIIHADGNGLGKVVQKVGKNMEEYRDFSHKLDECTREAAQEAFRMTVFNNDKIVPIRPVILGGDDITVICRADIAVAYTEAFMREFELQTEKRLGATLKKHNVFLGEQKLTSCAGIAFIKSSYPFYYGYNLAETLCEQAKNDAKNNMCPPSGLAPSCMMFHKVQDSFIDSFDAIRIRELTPAKNVSWENGPYYLHEVDGGMRWTIERLQANVDYFDEEDEQGVRNGLRQWMSLMHENPEKAEQKKQRILSLLETNEDILGMVKLITTPSKRTDNNIARYPVYDVMELYSVTYKSTR